MQNASMSYYSCAKGLEDQPRQLCGMLMSRISNACMLIAVQDAEVKYGANLHLQMIRMTSSCTHHEH